MKKLIGIILITCLAGCKDTHCPAFPPNLLDYFPYSKDEELRFENEDGDTLLLVVTNSWASDAYSFEWNCKCSCGANAGFETGYSTNYAIKLKGEINLGENSFEIINYLFDMYEYNDVFKYSIEELNPYNDEQILSLPDLIYIENEEYISFNKLKIKRSKGIVEFWDYKNECLWKKIE